MPTILKTKNSVTTTVVPTTLQQGELAVNITDKKMWVGNAATTPVQILGAGTTGTAAGSNTQVQYNSSGTLAGDADFTFNGTTVTMTNDASISGLTVGKGGGALTDNTTVGYLALNVNTTGAYNTAVGRQTLTSNITGAENAAFGWSSLYSNTGSNNTALGATSLYANTSGGSNTAVGNQALRFNTTASNNTAVGYQAAYTNQTGTYVTAIGYQAAYTTNTQGYVTAVGAFAGRLYSATSGESFGSCFYGVSSGQFTTTGVNNAFYGANSGYSNTTGGQNTAIGAGALSANTTGGQNTAVGFQAGYSATTGADNTHYGYKAGYSRTTGAGNTIVGDSAGYSLTTGHANTFVGAGQYSTQGAGYYVTTGSNNTVLGGYDGNQDGFDIRTASNYVVLSGGDGQRVLTAARGSSVALNDATPQFGTGITFPATQNASSNANTLDDYEEGEWTPTLGGTATYSARSGYYTKIGNFVFVQGTMLVNSIGTGSTTAVQAVPFVARSGINRFGGSVGYYASLNKNVIALYPIMEGSSTAVKFSYSNASSSSFTEDYAAVFKDGAFIIFSMVYLV